MTVVTFLLFLFISSNLTFFLLLPYRIWLKGSKIVTSLSDLCCVFVLFHLVPCNKLANLLLVLEPTLISATNLKIVLQEFTSLSLEFKNVSLYFTVHLKSLYGGIQSSSLPSSCPDIHRYVIFSKTGDIASLKNTDAKQEKSVLLFRTKSWWKRDRKQHMGGYEGIFPCYIVNCCGCSNLNNNYYSVAGVLYVLCMLGKSWRRRYSMAGRH